MAGWSIIKGEYQGNCPENRQNDELNDECLSDGDNDVKWDDCDDELRCLFDQVLMVLLRGVYAKNGIRPMPPLLGDGRSVDLFKLFFLVRDRGGFGPVSNEKLWGLVAEKFGFDYKLCASLKLIYFKYLDELDQWLNRITRDRVSLNGRYECGGNLSLLSLELEKRFRDFSTHGKGMVDEKIEDEEIEYDEICRRIDVALKKTFHFPDQEQNGEVMAAVVVVDDDDKLYDNKEFVGKENNCGINKDSTSSRKRKRDIVVGMLSWINNVAKNPCNPSTGTLPGCSRWKENGGNDFWSIALWLREARLCRRYADSDDDRSSSHQKKHKMHPSMYEDDIQPNHHSAEGLRCSKRLLSSTKTSPTPCHCHNSYSVHQGKPGSPCKAPQEHMYKDQDHVFADSQATKRTVGQSNDDPPVEKHVSVGPQFQAEVPIWMGLVSESDSKWLGTLVWSPDSLKQNPCPEFVLPGKGKAESCGCPFPGSVECYRFHIAERRMKLRHELGLVFYHWKFDRMGEEVSLSWSVEEEKRFKQIIKLNKPSLGKSFFPKKTRSNLVSYYYNVFLIRRRSYQNRVTPKDIDSDDDEAEFGSVSEAFGSKAVKIRGSEPVKCYQNEQVTDLD